MGQFTLGNIRATHCSAKVHGRALPSTFLLASVLLDSMPVKYFWATEMFLTSTQKKHIKWDSLGLPIKSLCTGPFLSSTPSALNTMTPTSSISSSWVQARVVTGLRTIEEALRSFDIFIWISSFEKEQTVHSGSPLHFSKPHINFGQQKVSCWLSLSSLIELRESHGNGWTKRPHETIPSLHSSWTDCIPAFICWLAMGQNTSSTLVTRLKPLNLRKLYHANHTSKCCLFGFHRAISETPSHTGPCLWARPGSPASRQCRPWSRWAPGAFARPAAGSDGKWDHSEGWQTMVKQEKQNEEILLHTQICRFRRVQCEFVNWC